MSKLAAPARTARENPVLATVAIIIVFLGVTTVVLLVAQQSAVQALRTSSSRGECRTHITNDAEDTNRHDVALILRDITDLLRQYDDNDVAGARATLEHAHDTADGVVRAPKVQDTIDDVCPKPLVVAPATEKDQKP